VLFVNEANNVEYKIFDHLRIRTRKTIWLDWNPSWEFWWYTEIVPNYDHDFLTITYLDNEALEPAIIEDIESHKYNKQWWAVYGLGQLGEVEGKIYKGWNFIDEIPHEARLERYGLDFGYSQDPAAIVDIYYYNGGYILDESLYQLGQSNKRIADVFNNKERALVVADSAEPKSIDELKSYAVNVIGANKGPGSVNQGISYVQDQKISVTKRSLNIIKEYRSYLWQTDKDDKIINVPAQGFDHAMDAIRYAMESLRPKNGDIKVHVPQRVQRALARHGQG
jgi:phage terminase large subunit